MFPEIEITTFSKQDKDVFEVAQLIALDGDVGFSLTAMVMLNSDSLKDKAIVAIDKSLDRIAGLLLIDEGETFVELSMIYVMKQYRKEDIGSLMIEKAKEYAATQMKIIKLYCNKDLEELYIKNGFRKSDNLVVMSYGK